MSDGAARSDESATPRPWFDAWVDAATGPAGFWRHSRVGNHFRTASTVSLLAEAITALMHNSAYSAIETVVELGAGDGRLLDALRRRQPNRRFIGVDIRPRPDDLRGVDWHTGSWDVGDNCWHGAAGELLTELERPTMIICAEWLDDLPCPIATPDQDGWRQILVDRDGTESPGDLLSGDHADWLARWWPGSGGRAESGLTRDRAWTSVINTLSSAGGSALMIDYGHLRDARPVDATLTGYVAGRQVTAHPDRSINLTAHVAVDSVAAAGIRAGATTEFLIDQRTAVDRLLPDDRGAPDDTDLLAVLQHRGERRLLHRTLGDHRWLLQQVPPPRTVEPEPLIRAVADHDCSCSGHGVTDQGVARRRVR